MYKDVYFLIRCIETTSLDSDRKTNHKAASILFFSLFYNLQTFCSEWDNDNDNKYWHEKKKLKSSPFMANGNITEILRG